MTYALVKAAGEICRKVPAARRFSMNRIAAVIHQWDAGRGADSATIALRTTIPEPVVCQIIAADQDRRRSRRRAA